MSKHVTEVHLAAELRRGGRRAEQRKGAAGAKVLIFFAADKQQSAKAAFCSLVPCRTSHLFAHPRVFLLCV